MEEFFGYRSAVDRYVGALPEGQGLIVFTRWMYSSGRLQARGSAWWKTVNGMMVCDIERASDVLEGSGSSFSSPDVAVDAWLDLRQRVGDKQRLLWRAHQVSLHRGIDLSRHLFDREPSAEQDFIRIVVENVDLAAMFNQFSGGPGATAMHLFLGLAYPKDYPAKRSEVGASTHLMYIDTKRYQDLQMLGLIGTQSGLARWTGEW